MAIEPTTSLLWRRSSTDYNKKGANPVPRTGPIPSHYKMGSVKAASQVAATTLAKRMKLRTRAGTIRLHKDAEQYHRFRDAISRAISAQFGTPKPREVLQLSFITEPHPLLQRAARDAGMNNLVWPESLAIWVTVRDDVVTVTFHEPSMIEHKVAYTAMLVPARPIEVPERESFASLFGRMFAPTRG